jgi:hypothetical protein
MDPKFAMEFESSKNFKDKQAELGAYVISTNLTKQFKKYCISFSGQIGEIEYKVKEFKPQTTTNNYIFYIIFFY